MTRSLVRPLVLLSIVSAGALASASLAQPAGQRPKPAPQSGATQFGDQPGLQGGDMVQYRGTPQVGLGVRGDRPQAQGQTGNVVGSDDGQSIRRRQPNRRPRAVSRRRP